MEETNVLLGESIVEKYDYDKSKNKLYELIDNYFIYELEFHYISPPRITPSYEIRYDSNKEFNRSSKTESYVINKITQEELLKSFYDDLYTIYNKLSLDELKYFRNHFLKKKPEYIIMNQMHLNRRSFDKIKRSCIIKMTIFFKIAISK